ncbi:beta-N-acetylglucosaminidase domain-containing protein [Listeria fleischmannii]|uniref:Hyaluronoglucosaminidase n=1 Tax=Listeria fleischmannii TaxID=1069827 RepID=A0A841YFW7_9LIST|nr:beta-N-acetylglucosaminidase domain-containing protein [Listeria fleischmannii]EIA20591.1 hyaluronoglucosaminidase [Listeria fleischmannii subsp. coloradonensis]MBC1399146.1 hyaluronoglucosaminidase [Listeria fleischmannii]MBC1427490.1 hyaluronoglucosaminidase [Listeria fleischmannii]STY36177.1 O-GlcNAcase BT_4395 precursor [Listeria fleischmannii subsp. coloradonensis]
MKYKENYLTGEYLSFKKGELQLRLESRFIRFGKPEDVPYGTSQPKDLFVILPGDTEEVCDLTLRHKFDRGILGDGFKLEIGKDMVTISASCRRGIRYGMEAFMGQIEWHDEMIFVPLGEIKHVPTLLVRGIVEGFYGTPWQYEDRLEALRFIRDHKLNTYMYAPKHDTLGRMNWREFYPKEELALFKEYVDFSAEWDIDFYYMISPGNDIDYTKEIDLEALFAKLKQLVEVGVTHFGLLLDDIDYVLKGVAKKRFKSPGVAHAYLVREVDAFLCDTLETYELVVCPTEYDNGFDSPYLEELGAHTPPEIPFFWTGPETLAHAITTTDIKQMSEIYGHPIIIWDNTPVNDFETDNKQFFLSPYENRTPYLAENGAVGLVANPMPALELSKITLHHMSQFAWFPGSENFDAALSEFAGDFLPSFRIFTAHNLNTRVHFGLSLRHQMLLREKDSHAIMREVEKLVLALRELKSLPNSRFQIETAQCLERAERELLLAQAIVEGDIKKADVMALELSEMDYQTSSNLPYRFYKNYSL